MLQKVGVYLDLKRFHWQLNKFSQYSRYWCYKSLYFIYISQFWIKSCFANYWRSQEENGSVFCYIFTSIYLYIRPRNLIDVAGSDLISLTPHDNTFWNVQSSVIFAFNNLQMTLICPEAVLHRHYVRHCSVWKRKQQFFMCMLQITRKWGISCFHRISRKSLLNLTKLGIKLFWKLLVSPYCNEV